MGLFRGASFDHGGVPETSPLASMGRFASLMGRFPTLMGHFTECLDGPFSLPKIPWKTAHSEKAPLEVLDWSKKYAIKCLRTSNSGEAVR